MDAMATAILRRTVETQNLTYRQVYDAINGSYDPELISDQWKNPHAIKYQTNVGSSVPGQFESGEMETSVFVDSWWGEQEKVVIMGPLEDLKRSGLPLEDLTFKFEGEVLVCGSYYARGTRYSWFYEPTWIRAWFDEKNQFHVKGYAPAERHGPGRHFNWVLSSLQEWKETDYYKLGGKIDEHLEEYAKTL